MKSKTRRIFYWILTSLFCAFMILSGVLELMQTESAKDLLISLGYPTYLNLILGVAKILGAIVLILPRFNVLKEWAYAGFSIDLVGATASFFLAGFGFLEVIAPLVFFILMLFSYFLWKGQKSENAKLKNSRN